MTIMYMKVNQSHTKVINTSDKASVKDEINRNNTVLAF